MAPHTKCVISVRLAERKMVDYLAEKKNSMGPPYWDTPKSAAAGPPRGSAGPFVGPVFWAIFGHLLAGGLRSGPLFLAKIIQIWTKFGQISTLYVPAHSI